MGEGQCDKGANKKNLVGGRGFNVIKMPIMHQIDKFSLKKSEKKTRKEGARKNLRGSRPPPHPLDLPVSVGKTFHSIIQESI